MHRSKDNQTEKHYEYGKPEHRQKEPAVEKEKPNLGLSGALTKDTNTFNGVVVKYNEPGEARKPKKRWRFYIFKDDKELPFIPMHRQSAYLIGKDRRVADIPVDHPSCSKQHAAFQYRIVEYERKDRSTGRIVKPYIIDLESTNGTFVNNQKIEPQRYFELREKDVVKFGFSSREYVLLHEESKNDLESEEDEDDVKEEVESKSEKIIDERDIKVEKPSRPVSPKSNHSPSHAKSKSKHKTKYSSESSSSSSDSDSEYRSRKKAKFSSSSSSSTKRR